MSDMLLEGLYSLTVFYLRVVPAFLVIPLFQGNWQTHSMLKACLATVLGLAFIPGLQPALQQVALAPIRSALTEITLGFLLAFPLGVPFWIVNVAGQIMDNQRGATISSTLDPNSGVDASLLASWFHFYCCAVFVAGNGIIHLCELLRQSYVLFPPGTAVDLSIINVISFIALLDLSVIKGIVLISPILITLFLTDIVLAVLSRYTPQLNPFALSLTIKSLIGFSVLFLYFNPLFAMRIQQFIDATQPLKHYLRWL